MKVDFRVNARSISFGKLALLTFLSVNLLTVLPIFAQNDIESIEHSRTTHSQNLASQHHTKDKSTKKFQHQQKPVQTASVNRSFWDIIRDLFRRKRQEGATKGDKFCSIAPNSTSSVSWSDRPLFLWQGSAKKLEIRRTPDDTDPIWSYTVPDGEQSVVYQGPSLMRDQAYFYWIEYESSLLDGRKVLDSTVMPLILLDSDRAKQINTDFAQEDNVEKRVTYLLTLGPVYSSVLEAEQELFLDVVRELFSTQVNESTWASNLESLRNEFCPSQPLTKDSPQL